MGSIPLRSLSDQHKLFVEYYLIHFNGARAARDAGFEPSNAKIQACCLMRDPLIKARVKERSAEIIGEIKEEQLRIFRELMNLGHSKIRDLYNPDGRLKPLDDWPEEIAACVASIKQVVKGTGKNKQRSLEVKLWNKNQALDILSRVTGLQTSELKLNLPDSTGSLYFPALKEIGAPVDPAIVERDEKFKLIQGEKTDNEKPAD